MSGHGSAPPPDRANDPARRMGREYAFEPVGMDLFDPKDIHPASGTAVRMISGPGVGRAAKPFTYIEHADTGQFHGMVLRASLQPKKKKG